MKERRQQRKQGEELYALDEHRLETGMHLWSPPMEAVKNPQQVGLPLSLEQVQDAETTGGQGLPAIAAQKAAVEQVPVPVFHPYEDGCTRWHTDSRQVCFPNTSKTKQSRREGWY